VTNCTCQPNDFPCVECPTHGLSGDQHYPPMDRHAHWLPSVQRMETAAEVQLRLYDEAHRSDAA
jgi:hypothetical protein